MKNKTDIHKLIELSKQQLQLELEAIRLAYSHNPSKGTEAENAIAKLLRRYLPKCYSLGSGFIINNQKLSSQLDIIIYDEILNAPSYIGGSSSIFLIGSVYGVIEVTLQKLNRKKLGEDIGKLSKLWELANDKIKFRKIVSKEDESGKGYVVDTEIIESGPAPRTYIIALSGTSYKDMSELGNDLKEITKAHGVHIHGLLIFDKSTAKKIKPGCEWLIKTLAYRDFEVKTTDKDAFQKFVDSMKNNFQGMLVGKYYAEP